MKYGRVLVTTVAAALAMPLLATAPGAMLNIAGGRTLVNGHNALSGSVIMAGDAVAVRKGQAELMLPGVTVLAAASTNFKLAHSRHAIRLSSGMLTIRGRMPVLVLTRSLIPASSSTVYSVKRYGGIVYAETERGSLMLTGAGHSLTVPAGSAVRFADTQTSATNAAGTSRLSAPVLVAIGTAVFAGAWIATYEATKPSSAVNSPSF